ncbi:hypothetical protein Tco_1105169 [Tanacetum coccineum]
MSAKGSGTDWLVDIAMHEQGTMKYKAIVADPKKDSENIDQEKDDNINSTNNVHAASINKVNVVHGKTSIELPDDPDMTALEDISIFDLSRDNKYVGAEADMNNLDITI